MPPNTQPSSAEMVASSSFINNFWSTNKSGMDKLLNYIKSTHVDLQAIQNVYIERSQIEKEYGQKLLSLSEKYEKETCSSDVYKAIITELKKTAGSRMELSEKLNGQVAIDIEEKVNEYNVLMEKWRLTLEEIFEERQTRISDLLKVREGYLREYEISKGQSTSASESLKSRYKVLVTDVDEIAQEWNTTWQEACEVMEAMEEDRIELIKGNVWEYANLGSSSLLVQDQWCENIRTSLEECSAEEEIDKCVSLHATGSQIPSTNEYVNEIRNEQKRKSQATSTKSHEPPRPPTKPERHPPSAHVNDEATDDLNRKKSSNSNNGSLINAKDNPVKQPMKQTPQQHVMKQEQHTKKDTNKSISQSVTPCSYDDQVQSNNRTPSINFRGSVDSKQLNHIKNNISNNGGSTATRAPIRRKPLDKALMEQVSNEMAMARKQRDTDKQVSTISSSSKKQSYGSLNSSSENMQEDLTNIIDDSKSVSSDVSKPETNSFRRNIPAKDSTIARRQPSEYKPDSGSIPKKRGNTAQVMKEIPHSVNTTAHMELQHEQLTHPIAAPKSPRPPPQQIATDLQRSSSQINNQNGGYGNTQIANNIHTSNAIQPTPNHQNYLGQQPHMGPQANTAHIQPMQQVSQLQHSTINHQQRSPMMQPSPLMQPQRSPLMQPQASPMMQPQRSPMMQPQASPMIQPQRYPQASPIMGAPVSPLMQPLHSPAMTPAYVSAQHQQLPPPITIPAHNYIASPQPSPNMSYANPVSPSFAPASPAVLSQQLPPKPTHYLDGSPILFWVRSKYDYEATDSEELSFRAFAAIGIVEGDMTQEAWWSGAVFDEYHQTWSNVGSVPSNFTEPDQPKYFDHRKKNAYY